MSNKTLKETALELGDDYKLKIHEGEPFKQDQEQIKQFFKFLDHEHPTAYQLFYPRDVDKPPQGHKFIESGEKAVKYCNSNRLQGLNCFGINQRPDKGTKSDEIQHLDVILFDVDVPQEKRPEYGVASKEQIKEAYRTVENLREKMEELGFNMDYLDFSGNGFHPGFKVDVDIEDAEDYKETKVYRKLERLEEIGNQVSTENVEIDAITKDFARRVKIPGTWNVKSFKEEGEWKRVPKEKWRRAELLHKKEEPCEEQNTEAFHELELREEEEGGSEKPSMDNETSENERIKWLMENDYKFEKLYQDETGELKNDYDSRSEKEMALSVLAETYRFDKDKILSNSALTKWDEDGEKYQKHTADKAEDLVSNYFDWNEWEERSEKGKKKLFKDFKDELNPKDNSGRYLDTYRNYNPSSIDAKLVSKRITVRGNIKGQKQGEALPLKANVWCKECNSGGFTLNLEDDLTSFITSRTNQHNLIQSKLSDKECSECESSNWGFKPTEYVDKSWIQLQDLIEDSEEFSITQNNKIPVYIVDDKLPSTKTVKVRGEVHVNGQNDEIFILADEIEPEEENFSQIELTKEDHQEYREKWSKEEAEKMVATDMVGRPKSRTALQLTAHSPTRIPTITGDIVRGSLRTGFFGDGGTYKSKQVKDLTKDHYRLGGFVNAENSGRTGLTYTIDNDKKVIEWGALVLNDKGLVGIDGLNELHGDELTQIREVLEDQQVEVNRSVQGSAPARTRVIGCWNPPKQLFNYQNPAKALQDMDMFSGPDYRRWDLLVPFKDGDVDKQDIHYRDDGEKPYSEDFYKKHVKWAWNLTPEDIVFGNQFESELKTQSYNIANSYEFSNLPIVSGAFREKLTRLVVSWAVLKHSVTEEGKVKVTAEHVKETKEFFEGLMEDLGIDDAKAEFQEKNTLTEEEFEELVEKYDDDQIEILRVVYEKNPISSSEIGSQVGLSDTSVKSKWSDLKGDDLLRVKKGQGATTTPRTMQFMDMVDEVDDLTSESDKGGGGVDSYSEEESGDKQGKIDSFKKEDGDTPPTPSENKRQNDKNDNQKEDLTEKRLKSLAEERGGKIYAAKLEEMGFSKKKAYEIVEGSEELSEAFGTPDNSSDLQNVFVLDNEVDGVKS